MRSLILSLILIFVLLPVQLSSEPTPRIRFLMNEPVTLFDWGIFKVEKD